MAKIVVTGSSGFLGSEIVRQAIGAGHEVTALRRATSDVSTLAGLPVRWVVGDVNQPGSLRQAMEGAEYCIHTAGDTSYFLKHRRRLEEVNVRGTAHVIEAARQAGVRRMVHTSSVAAVGYDPAGGEATEATRWNWPSGLPYMETKRDGERLALGAARAGFEVIALNPATILGPGRMNASEEQLLDEIRSGRIPLVPPGGMTVCDVADVAAAHLAALTRGRSGERYILGGTSLTHQQLFRTFARAFRAKVPERKAPEWLISAAGHTLFIAEKARLPIGTPSAMLRLARLRIYHSSEKAKAELGYRPRPLEEVVARVVRHRSAGA